MDLGFPLFLSVLLNVLLIFWSIQQDRELHKTKKELKDEREKGR